MNKMLVILVIVSILAVPVMASMPDTVPAPEPVVSCIHELTPGSSPGAVGACIQNYLVHGHS